MKHSFWFAALTVVFGAATSAGCLYDAPRTRETSISKLSQPEVRAHVVQNVMRDGKFVSEMVLEAYLSFHTSLEDDDCWAVPKLKATLGSFSLEVSSGGFVSDDSSGDGICKRPRLSVNLDDLIEAGLSRSDAVLTMFDSTGSVSVSLGDTLVARTAELVAPPSGGYHPGDVVTVRWLPESDLKDTSRCSITYEWQSVTQVAEGTCGNGPFAITLLPSTPTFAGAVIRPSVGGVSCQNDQCVEVSYLMSIPISVVAPPATVHDAR